MTDKLIIILVLVGAYFLLILAAILWARYKKSGTIIPGLEEFFLAGRNIHPFVLLSTYVGSLFSASFALALPAFVFAHGLGGGLFVIASDMLGVVFMLTFYKTLRAFSAKHKTFSPIECLSIAYNNKWLGLICAVLMTFFLSPYISMQLVGMGKFLEGLTNGEIGYVIGVGSMMAVVALYLIFGGMRAVAYTDFIQTIAIFIGVFGSVAFFVYLNWGGLSAMMEDVMAKTPDHLSLPGPEGFYNGPMFFAAGIFSLSLLFQPHLLTRAMMARDDRQINFMGFGLLLALLLGMIPVFLFGIGGAALYGNTVAPNQSMGHIFQTLSAASFWGLIFTGFMMIGALGAAMSTADSLLLAIGQIFTRDIALPFTKMTEKFQVLFSKLVMLLVLLGAFMLGLKPPALMGDLVLYSSSATCILVPTFLGFQLKSRSQAAAFGSIAAGMTTLLALALTQTRPFGFHEGFVTLAVTAVVYFGICGLKKYAMRAT